MYDILKNRCIGHVTSYSDVSDCLELMAVYDDQLKKDDNFCNYAVDVANRIIQDLKIKDCEATYGKWGSRLETEKNPKYTIEELKGIAVRITEHPSWLSLKASTHVFTYGNYEE